MHVNLYSCMPRACRESWRELTNPAVNLTRRVYVCLSMTPRAHALAARYQSVACVTRFFNSTSILKNVVSKYIHRGSTVVSWMRAKPSLVPSLVSIPSFSMLNAEKREDLVPKMT